MFSQEYNRIQDRYVVEQERNQTYHQQLAEMETPTYWELEARKQLGLVLPGESVYKLVNKRRF
mgnify:FL=1